MDAATECLEAQTAFENGDLERAAALARQAAASGEEDADALLARILSQTGDLDDAETHARTALERQPDDVVTMAYLGMILMALGRGDEAVAAYRRAVDTKPGNAILLNELGNALAAVGRIEDALAALREAAAARADIPEIHNNLGNVLRSAGQGEAAAASYREALQLLPDYPEAHSNLGVVLQEAGDVEAAADAFERSIGLDPENALVHTHLGTAYATLGRLTDAVAAHREAIRLAPDLAAAHNNLAIALKDQGLLAEAREAYAHALDLEPDASDVHSNLLMCLAYDPDIGGEALLAAHRAWADRHEQPEDPAFEYALDPERQLTIGIVSPDLWSHSVACFVEPFLEHHDRDRYRLVCYADVDRPDETTERLRTQVDAWRAVAPLDDDALYDRILSDRVDILIDLAGHTSDNRLLLFGRRAAPVQVSWLGYGATTGLSQMDYRIVDGDTDPEGATEAFYSEKLLRLSGGFLCYKPPADAPLATGERGDRPLTFGSFNNLAKVGDGVIALWSRILAAVPESRILLKCRQLADPGVRARVEESFWKEGITADRLDLRGRVASRADHLATYADVDVALDTFPYNGATTTCEALWMGVPVVTLSGRLFVGRFGRSILHRCGLDDWVAETPDQYVSLAHAVAANLPDRRILREWIAESDLVDGEAFARSMEKTLRAVWHDHCAGQSGGE